MRGWRGVVAVAMTAAVVGGCSSSASEQSGDPTSTTDASSKQQNDDASASVDGGVAAPDTLSAFQCEPDDQGRWRASGTLTNGERDDAAYRVTVVVAPPGTPSATAREITVPDVASGESVDFTSEQLPATTGDDPLCSVQVVRLR